VSWKYRRAFLKAQKHLEENQFSASEAIYSQLLDEDSKQVEARLHRAYVRMRMGMTEEALIDAQICVDERPENGVMFMLHGEILLDKGDPLQAYASLLKACGLEKDNGRAYFHLGRACLLLGKKKEAADYFEIALQFERDYTMAQFMSEVFAQSLTA
jgi:tetratricopeptide (TPR) repeat protein